MSDREDDRANGARVLELIAALVVRGGFTRVGIIACAQCDSVEAIECVNVEARWVAVGRGWERVGGVWLCPVCSGTT